MFLEVKEDRDKLKRHLCVSLARRVIIAYQEMWSLRATQVEPRATSKDLTVLRVGQFHTAISMYNYNPHISHNYNCVSSALW
ncbi:hypothetical protein LEMLEM_LOCUS15428, partial [Lemmus lemmus]